MQSTYSISHASCSVYLDQKKSDLTIKMQFLEYMTPTDWMMVAVFDMALFYVGYLAGEDSVLEKKTDGK